jgi:hypothetical protein
LGLVLMSNMRWEKAALLERLSYGSRKENEITGTRDNPATPSLLSF